MVGKTCILFTLFIGINAFTPSPLLALPRQRKNSGSLKLMDEDYLQQLDYVQKYRYFFEKNDYNHLIQDLLNDKVSKIFVNDNYKELVYSDKLPTSLNPDDLKWMEHYHLSNINPVVLPNLVQKSAEHNIPIYFVNFIPDAILNIQHLAGSLLNLVTFAFPILFVFSIFSSIFRAGTGGGSGRNNILNNNNRNAKNNFFGMQMPTIKKKESIELIQNISLADWAGSPEVIEECEEVINYIDNKDKFKQIGAEMPKGILLEGPPGTGKTLLAKAIASETNSTFFACSGSEFVELFVGMGAAKVRDLFENARENTPSIIFIDEIDAIGKQRGNSLNAGNDEREQTLNQLLYEMDGFNNNTDIVVIAATNRKDILDQALLRPGRFDRIITIPVPDRESRIKILDHYLKEKPLEKKFDIDSIVDLTDGLSGAQLKNIVNEAAILSVRNNHTTIQEKYMFDAFEKILFGIVKRSANILPETNMRVAIHEAGHSLLVLKYNQYFEFKKASIQPTYNGAGGYTLFNEKPQYKDGLYTKDLLKKRLIVSMGGKAAESIYYGNDYVSLGAIRDLQDANDLAKKMVGNFGMGKQLEVFFNENNDDSWRNKNSEYTQKIIDTEALNLVKEAYEEATKILEQEREHLLEFSKSLVENSVLYKNDLPLPQ